VRALRRHMGLSQEELAGELGTRQQTVSEWETGRYRPRGTSARLLTIVAERAGFEYETGGTRQETGDTGQETGGTRRETGDTRQETGDTGQETGDKRGEGER